MIGSSTDANLLKHTEQNAVILSEARPAIAEENKVTFS